ncbi:nuclear protein e3-3 [Holotrichia oblita]|uniref:Nuclear protein e3-3 n=3 Tax=Holotrichia oblita TaxID=644536 RepID=A0ACB9TP86_HOLOL|nr:nuclear protein e3-3 [Holotrichia oblita]KAI4468454.1 nuclear protein e3-3 [Holotrichia oblita]KAI4468469.1 nuclear protein e3-3 [Holotrichia oblita]
MSYSIRTLIRNITKINSFHLRSISKSARVLSYDGEGKTTVNILNNEEGVSLMINGFSQTGFRLNNDMTVLGPMAIFPRSVLSWNVGKPDDIDEESLCLFTVLEPKIDILVVGVGDKVHDLSFHKKLFPFARKHNINLEILPTDQACSTFNFLNAEGRYVAAALIPPEVIDSTDDDVLKSKMRYQSLYETD